RQVPHPGKRRVHEVLPRAAPAVPVLPGDVPGRRPERPAAPVLVPWQQGSGPAPLEDARARRQQAVAGRAGGDDRSAADGRERVARVLPAAGRMAEAAEPGEAMWLVT